jgi:hypothetical protein
MAIRRGPLAAPEDATKVFDVFAGNDSSYKIPTGFVTDLVIGANRSGSDKFIGSRLTGRKAMRTNTTQAEGSGLPFPTDAWQYNDGVKPGFFAASTAAYWLWKRAPSYFDVVAYTGNGGGNRDITHNLGSAPEMLWLKRRVGSSPYGDWYVQHTGIAASNYINLNEASAQTTSPDAWNSTYASANVFRVGSDNNVNNFSYIVYLFGTVAGVSKVGSYSGTGSDQNIDCGFSSGARFVLTKRYTGNGGWQVRDSARGITTASNDPWLELQGVNAEYQDSNMDIDPLSSGFTVSGADIEINASGHSYIFYAIA